MTDSRTDKNRRTGTTAVIVISLAGILFFGYQAVRVSTQRAQNNPFEYDIARYMQTDARLVHYAEAGQIPFELPRASGLAIGPDANIYVAGDEAIHVFDTVGVLQSTIGVDGLIRCFALDNNRDLYVGMESHIEIYDLKGTKKAEWESPDSGAVFSALALSEDFVFVTDAGNRIVWKFDKSGNVLQQIGKRDVAKDIPGFVVPSGFIDVAVDADGFLWVANPGRHSIENYTLDGDFRTSWGAFSMEIDGFCGCCNPTNFIILEDGSFITSEKGIPRIKVHNQLGEVVSVVAGAEQFDEGTVGLDLAVDSNQRIFVLDPKRKRVRIFAKKEA